MQGGRGLKTHNKEKTLTAFPQVQAGDNVQAQAQTNKTGKRN